MTDRRFGPRTLATALGDWRAAAPTLADALVVSFRAAVLDGRIGVGDVLPSERALAEALDVSRGTLVSALAVLRRDGWVVTRHGSGSETRLPPWVTERTTPWLLDHPTGGLELDLTQAVTSAPYDAYAAAAWSAASALPPLLLDDGAGDPGLRDVLAARFSAQGLPTRPEQMLVTTGARAALALILDELHDRRHPVLVESPTYHGALQLLRRHRARLQPVAVTAHGWDLDAVARSRPGALAYLVPDFHNPTGALMQATQRRQLAALVDRLGLTLVVDETMRDLDLRVPPRPVPRITGPGVVTVGSASKTAWGGVRLGWIRADATIIRRLRRHPLADILSPAPLTQLAARRLLEDVDGLLVARRAQLRAQRDHLVNALRDSEEWDEEWDFVVPDGGLTLWLRLRRVAAGALVARARRAGLAVAPGTRFTTDGTAADRVRLPFTAHSDALDRAVEILRDVLG